MIKKQIFKWIVVGVSLAVAVGAVSFIYKKIELAPTPSEIVAPRTVTISLDIADAYHDTALAVQEGETVFEVLQQINTTHPEMKLETKEYAGLGILVNGMYGMRGGSDKKYWQYTVNGIAPEIGAAQYKLKNTDAVVWKFAEFTQQ